MPAKTTAITLVNNVIPTYTLTDFITVISVFTALLCLPIFTILTNLTNLKTLIDLESIAIKNGKTKGIIASKSMTPMKENT